MGLAITFTSPAYVDFTMLLRAIQHGEITPSREETEMRYSQLARVDLVKLAKKKRDHALFLFPRRRPSGRRTSDQQKQRRVHVDRERDMTKITVGTNYGQVAETINNTIHATISQAGPRPELRAVAHKIFGHDEADRRFRHRIEAEMNTAFGGRLTLTFPPGDKFRVLPFRVADDGSVQWGIITGWTFDPEAAAAGQPWRWVTIPQPHDRYMIDVWSDSDAVPQIRAEFTT
jgi:hypothetical protein